MQLNPYLFFKGDCAQALEFYREALGAEILFSLQYKDTPQDHPKSQELADNIAHAKFRIGDATLFASDSGDPECDMSQSPTLSLTVTKVADAQRLFDALSTGGKVLMPLDRTFWSPAYGMATDRFGITWMVNTEDAQKK